MCLAMCPTYPEFPEVCLIKQDVLCPGFLWHTDRRVAEHTAAALPPSLPLPLLIEWLARDEQSLPVLHQLCRHHTERQTEMQRRRERRRNGQTRDEEATNREAVPPVMCLLLCELPVLSDLGGQVHRLLCHGPAHLVVLAIVSLGLLRLVLLVECQMVGLHCPALLLSLLGELLRREEGREEGRERRMEWVIIIVLWCRCGVVWCGVVWCGVVWCCVVWCGGVGCGVVWCGVVWCGGVGWGVVWCCVVWCGGVGWGVVWCGVVWCGGVGWGGVWCGVVWCGVVWCGVVWCGVVWCGVVLTASLSRAS